MTPMDEEKLILQHIFEQGYAWKTSMKSLIQKSNSTVDRRIRSLLKKKFIASIELKSKEMHKAYHLVEEGLKFLGVFSSEIKKYQKQLKSIHHMHVPHYLHTRNILGTIKGQFLKGHPEYLIEMKYEFEHISYLKVSFHSEKGEKIFIRSDGEMSISAHGNTYLTVLLETDCGTEHAYTLEKKIKKYVAFKKSVSIREKYHVHPLYILFAVPEKTRIKYIKKITQRVCNEEESKSFWFLRMDELETKDLFQDLITDIANQSITLQEVVERRKNLLNFHFAVDRVIPHEDEYQIHVFTRYREVKDYFFPLNIRIGEKVYAWNTPHGYIRIFKKSCTECSDALFCLIFDATRFSRENFVRYIKPYDAFLADKDNRSQITPLDQYYGLMIIMDDIQKETFLPFIKKLQIYKRVRVVSPENCITKNLLYEEVWLDEKGDFIRWFPCDKKDSVLFER